MKKPLISIIVPVYNCYHLIDRFLESFENQTSKNFEIVFCDDFSTDNTYYLLEKKLENYKFNYKLFKNQKNEGPGVTRNNAIAKSSGDYLTFVDPDDFVTLDFVEKIEKIIKKYNSDAIIFDFNIVKDTKVFLKKSLPVSEKNISTEIAVALSNGMCWGKVFKKDIIFLNKILFPNLMRSEDLAFSKVALSKCKKIYYLQDAMYNYVIVNTSIMHNKKTLNINNNILSFEYIENNVKSDESLEMVFIREYLYLITQILITQKENTKNILNFIHESEKKFPNWYKNKYIKYQPMYIKVILFFIKVKFILPLRLIFLLK